MKTYTDDHSIPWHYFVFSLPFSTKQFEHVCYTRGRGYSVHYLILNIHLVTILQKRCQLFCRSIITKGYPFTILFKNTESPLNPQKEVLKCLFEHVTEFTQSGSGE